MAYPLLTWDDRPRVELTRPRQRDALDVGCYAGHCPMEWHDMKPAAWLMLVLVLFAARASGQTVYKCIGKDGHITLTSEACKASEKQAAAVYAPPERMTRERYDEIERRRRRSEADSRYLQSLADGNGRNAVRGYSTRSASSTGSKAARCQQAKAERQRVRDAMGMRIPHLTARRLDEMVYDACK